MKIKWRKIMTAILLFLGLSIVVLFVFLQHPLFGSKPEGERLIRMQQSKNYKNGQFHNLSNTPALAEGEMLFPKTLYTKPTDSIPFVKTNLSTLDKNTDYLV